MIAVGERYPLSNGVEVVRVKEKTFHVDQRGKTLQTFRTWGDALQFAEKTGKESSEVPPPRRTWHVYGQRMNKSTDVPHLEREGILSREDAKRYVLESLAEKFPTGYFVELFTDDTIRVKCKRTTYEYRIAEDK